MTTEVQRQLLHKAFPPPVSEKWSLYHFTLEKVPQFILQSVVQITILRLVLVKVQTNLLPLLLLRSTFNKIITIL